MQVCKVLSPQRMVVFSFYVLSALIVQTCLLLKELRMGLTDGDNNFTGFAFIYLLYSLTSSDENTRIIAAVLLTMSVALNFVPQD